MRNVKYADLEHFGRLFPLFARRNAVDTRSDQVIVGGFCWARERE
jgi:hypothetical protein